MLQLSVDSLDMEEVSLAHTLVTFRLGSKGKFNYSSVDLDFIKWLL